MEFCRSSDLSEPDGDEAADQEGDQEADSPAQSSGGAGSDGGSGESRSGSEASSGSELLELEEEGEGLEVAEVDLEAPRSKRRRAVASTTHEGHLAQSSGTPGQHHHSFSCMQIAESMCAI